MKSKYKSDISKSQLKIKINTNENSVSEIRFLITEKVEYIQEIIRNTILSVRDNKNHDIFSNSDYNVCITTMNELYDNTKIIVEKNNSSESQSCVDNIIDLMQKTIDKLAIVISSFGTKNIEDLIFISFGTEFKKNKYDDKIIESKYELIKKYIHPTGYKIISWKNKKKCEYSSKYYCENKIVEDSIIIENANSLECFDTCQHTKSFYSKINGIQVVIQNPKLQKTLIVSGIVDDIILDFLSNSYVNFRKKNTIENVPKNQTFDTEIISRVIDSMTLKDMLVSGNNDIYKKQLAINSDVNSIKYNKLDSTIKRFLEMEMLSQRNMLINLLTYNKEEDVHYITYLLYDLITVNNNENLDSHEQKIIFDSFPWKIKSYFKDAMKITVKYAQDMTSKYDINRISLEQQIYILKVPENVKEKAMSKLKEIKGKSDDTTTKAKQYLEGIIKIPFGIYKKEPVLKILKEINKNFFESISKNVDFYNEISFERKEFYNKLEIVKILDSANKNIYKHFAKDIKEKVRTANSKQLTSLIQYYQNLQKNNIIKDCDLLENVIKSKTKSQKLLNLNILLDSSYSNNQLDNNVLIHLYKIYELFENPISNHTQSISRLPIEIRDLNTNINEISGSLNKITNVLDESIHGHCYAKNQLLKIIGQWMSGEQTGYCFGFEGSPGVGKTSLAKKGLANCLKDENGISRPFSFIALGGSCNGSTLEGHSYTYVNSNWGRILDILMETKCMNPIIYIDELDKVSKTEHGKEIIGILTHLIDPTQNDVFQDKYFSGIDIDLSKALFIFSYNDPEQIDRVLLDRIHRIKFDNLTLDDKMIIVEKHILPEINKKMGFSNTVSLSSELIEHIIEYYTLEPGVRKLKEVLFDLYGEINIELLKGENISDLPVLITKEGLEKKYLKKYNKIEEKKINTTSKVGVINGLWANSLGKGGIIPIEAVFFPTSTFLDLRLTGLQGDVMKESMNVAKTLAWSLTETNRKTELLKLFETTKSQGLHIHCPEGAVSKDGPSAGTAITSVIYSLFNNKKIKNNIAITGEINLQGDVMAIGGLETKILGGIRAGVEMFLYPQANSNDYEEFVKKCNNKSILENTKFISVTNIKEVFQYVFE